MIDRATKLRWRRRYRRSRRHVEDLGVQTEEHLERHLFRRLSRLYQVRRFIAAWLLLIIALMTGIVLQTRALSGYYQTLAPAPGGTYTEGIIGSFTNANPLYASGSVDGAVSKLLFSSLLTYDQNNQLTGDLAESWEVDESELVYTVRLRKDVKWHDGRPLTAADVMYTYQIIQNPDAKSPLQTSWMGIKLSQPDDYTVVFTLPNVLSSFPYALTNGIVPKHLLESTAVGQLRSSRFNTAEPVGSGPFKWDAVEVVGMDAQSRQERVGLVANQDYYKGAPKLQRFVVRSFRDEKQLIQSFKAQELDAMVGLNTLPDEVKALAEVQDYNIPLTGEVLVFFKTSMEVLQDSKVRQALVKAVDTKEIIRGLDHPVIPVNSPLLESQLGYDKNLVQHPTNVAEANALLDAAGWVRTGDGVRQKDGKPLAFTLYAQSTGEYTYVTQQLQRYWRDIGVDLEVALRADSELQTAVALHAYDALLYGISVGNDPDVFAYWHSSQADPRAATRLNLSEYKSAAADRALEAGRTRTENNLRAAKYRPFLEAWRNDAPALGLYQPRFLYVTRGEVYGFQPNLLNNAIERYNNVEAWMIREVKTNKQPTS